MTRTNETEVTGAKRGENATVVVLGLEPSKKEELFCHGEVFFLLTRPLMGDPVVFTGSENSLVGKPGIVQDRLAASGYIRVRGELRQAEVVGGGPPIDKGEKVRVQDMRGLTLLVQPDNEKNNVKKNG